MVFDKEFLENTHVGSLILMTIISQVGLLTTDVRAGACKGFLYVFSHQQETRTLHLADHT